MCLIYGKKQFSLLLHCKTFFGLSSTLPHSADPCRMVLCAGCSAHHRRQGTACQRSRGVDSEWEHRHSAHWFSLEVFSSGVDLWMQQVYTAEFNSSSQNRLSSVHLTRLWSTWMPSAISVSQQVSSVILLESVFAVQKDISHDKQPSL